MTNWKSFQTRALSALTALFLIGLCFYFWNIKGLQIITYLVVAMGAWELRELLLPKENSHFLRHLFFVLILLVFATSSYSLTLSSIAFATCLVVSIVSSLLALHSGGDLQRITRFHSAAAIGLFYIGLLPSFAYRLLSLPDDGLSWFIYLLAVVFAGDTLAYGFGVLWGKNKMMPSISPKKSWQGSIGGALGSLLAGVVCAHYLLPQYNFAFLVGLAVVAGYAGQFGDFFESLLKRIADVKDSGKIMPGHGGVLDRIDGVLFASPIVLMGVFILTRFFV